MDGLIWELVGVCVDRLAAVNTVSKLVLSVRELLILRKVEFQINADGAQCPVALVSFFRWAGLWCIV